MPIPTLPDRVHEDLRALCSRCQERVSCDEGGILPDEGFVCDTCNPPASLSPTLSTGEVTALRGWSRARIGALIEEGRLTPTKDGHRNVFDRTQVEALVIKAPHRPVGSKSIPGLRRHCTRKPK